MNKIAMISSLVFLIVSQSAFAENFRNVTLCNNASSVNTARIIIYDAEGMLGDLEAEQGKCNVKSLIMPNLIEVRVFYGGDNNAPKYIRLSNAMQLRVEHKNYYLPNGKLAETTDLVI